MLIFVRSKIFINAGYIYMDNNLHLKMVWVVIYLDTIFKLTARVVCAANCK